MTRPRTDGITEIRKPDQVQANTEIRCHASPSSIIIESELVFMVLGNGCEYIIIISNARARCIISLHTSIRHSSAEKTELYYYYYCCYYITRPLCYVYVV